MIQVILRLQRAQTAWRVEISSNTDGLNEAAVPILEDRDLESVLSLPAAARTWLAVRNSLSPNSSFTLTLSLQKQVGSIIFQRLLGPAALRQHLVRVEERSLREQRRIQYVLLIDGDDPTLTALPLELAFDSGDEQFFFKRPDRPVFRCAQSADAQDLVMPRGTRVLLVTAHDEGRAPSAKELEDHGESLLQSLEGAGFYCELLRDATPHALENRLRSGAPVDVLYIASHGVDDVEHCGSLSLRGGFVTGQRLGIWLEEARARERPVHLVMLCACSSAVPSTEAGTTGMAQFLAGKPRARAALGFRGPVNVDWALRFFERLFASIGAGADLEAAYASARLDADEGDPQWTLPLLFSRPVDLWKAARSEYDRAGLQPLATEAVRQLMEERDADLRAASALMASQQFEAARTTYEKAVKRLHALTSNTSAGTDAADLLARAQLGLAMALLLLQEDDARIRELLADTKLDRLTTRGKALLSQAWSCLGGMEQAALALAAASRSKEDDPQVEVARQLLALRQGTVPERLSSEPTVLLAAARCHAEQGQASAAVRCASAVLEACPDDGLFYFIATDVLTRILRNSVYENPSYHAHLRRDEWPTVLRRVLDAHERLATLRLPGKLLDARDETKALLADLLRDSDPQFSKQVRKEPPAYSLARQGKLAEAFAAVPDSDHPWLSALHRASLYLVAGERQLAREAALAIELAHPGRLPVEHLIASILMEQDQPEEARPYAQRAYASLPAGGLRQLLVECLLACNRHEAARQAWQLLADGTSRESPRELRSRASAAEHVDLGLAATLWDQYLTLCPKDSVCWLHAAGIRYILGEQNNAANYAWQAFEHVAERRLSPQHLATVADFVQGGSDLAPSERQQRIEQIIERLQRDYPDEPLAEHEVLNLALALRDPQVFGKIRFDLLERHGFVLRGNSVEELKQALEQHTQYQQALGWLYRAGLWPYEALPIGAAELAQRAFANRSAKEPLLSTPVPLPVDDTPPLTTLQFLTGPLELFLLERLKLLGPLKRVLQAGGRLLLFSQTTERINGTLLNLTAQIQQTELQALDDNPDAAGQLMGLRDRARRTREVWRFVAEGLRERWIESGLEWPTVALPLLGDAGHIFQSTWERALGYRAALVDHPTRYLLSVDFLTCALFGGGDFLRVWLQFLRPEPEQFVRLVEKLSGTTKRMITLPQLVRKLVEAGPERNRHMRLLAELGFVDALQAQDLPAVFRETGMLARIERLAWLPYDAPTGGTLQPQPERETVHPGRHMAMVLIANEYVAGIVQAFCPSGDATSAHEESDALLHALFDRLEAMPGAALELACLALARQVAPRFRKAIVEESPQSAWISGRSPVGQLWIAVWRWAGVDERRCAAVQTAVSAQLCRIDLSTWPRTPTWAEIATSLLGSATVRPNSAVAILSANWEAKPLTEEELPEMSETPPANWEEIFQQAARVLEQGGQVCTEDDGNTWSVLVTRGQRPVWFQLPAEGVLLRTNEQTIARLAPQLALGQSGFEGRAYSLLTALAASPDDQEQRRAVARLAVGTPWRLMRESPSWLLRWASFARMPDAPLPASIDELRAMLCEPGPLPRDPDQALLIERTHEDSPWAKWPGLAAQASLIPGSLCVFGLGPLCRSPLHAQRVQQSISRLAQPEEYPAALIAQDLLYLSIAASQGPTLRVSASEEVAVRKELPELMARCLQDAVLREGKDSKDTNSVLADHEPGLLRVCAHIVGSLAWPELLPHRDGIWLSYRLYQWYMVQLLTLDRDARIVALRQLALAYPSPIPGTEIPLDLFHPSRLGPDGTSYRLMSLLFAVTLSPAMYWLVQQGTQPLPAPDLQTLGIASPSLEAILLELAVRSLTPAEQQIKRAALKTAPSSFGWSKDDAVTIPELALHALLSRRQHAFGEMPLSARMQWIGRLPRMHNDADSVPGNLINLVLEAASLDTPGLHADEKQLLRERSGLLLKHAEDWFSNDHCGLRLRAAWLCRIRLYEAGELDLAFELEVLFRDHQDRELARFLFPHYVVALAEVAADTLEREIRTVLSQELARGEDVAKWIQPTEQVVSSCKPHVQPGIQALLAEFAMRAGGARTGHSKIPDHPQSRPR